MNDYADYEVTPEPVPFWDSIAWLDLDETLLGFDYGDAPVPAAETSE
jgi:hypothetical protein